MPSSPKIPKETILKFALQIVIRDGYTALNIKALAKEIGCSTQPISWHFGGMEGLRTELGKYALLYAERKQYHKSDGIKAFSEVGTAYIDIAFDEPKLFQYLFMSTDGGYFIGGLDGITRSEDNLELVAKMALCLNISKEKAGVYCRNMVIYTHGLASLLAAGLINSTKQEVHEMMSQASDNFLLKTYK